MIPRLTIITSVYKADDFISNFLIDMVQMDQYSECQHIIVNANSPGNEYEKLKPFINDKKNVQYIYLSKDPGLYDIWNICIGLSSAQYLTTANVDDCRSSDFITSHCDLLDSKTEIDIVSAPVLVTNKPNEIFVSNSSHDTWYKEFNGEYFKKDLFMYDNLGNPKWSMNIPHSNPVWRKTLHEKFGYFNQNLNPFADWDFWLRCASGGARFWNLSNPKSLYYHNPSGLSTTKEKQDIYNKLNSSIIKKHYP